MTRLQILSAAVAVGMGALAIAGCSRSPATSISAGKLADNSSGDDWAGFGRTYGEQHFSPLADVNDGNVAKLGLAWSIDLPPGNSLTGPIAVDGVVYFASGYSLVHAVDARAGKVLWTYDPKAPEAAGRKLRQGWGSRGIAYWNGKVYTGTIDGRLIAIDAKSGKQVWSAMTVGKDDVRFISGPPRAFDGKVIIGHGGADVGDIRGYVTAYDTETGKQLWRFYTVPGNPADGFENDAMKMAANSWSGDWWKYGGGGTVWNAITYDADTDTVLLGTGNGAPWNHKVRSGGKGDNLFLCSIVALDAKTGAYKWHYQINPGESWDYNASMDMELAELNIGGTLRKVLITAPKNGFFYVIDRTNGKLISAEPFVPVNWASKIDLATGRPVENPDARYPDGKSVTVRPAAFGAHNWLPMAFSPKTGLVYVPATSIAAVYSDKGIVRDNWKRTPGNALDSAVNMGMPENIDGAPNGTSYLVAIDPVTHKQVWKIATPSMWSGSTMATAGNLVFQGHMDGTFNAYSADRGRTLWSFATQAPAVGPPITYRAGGRQYVTVITGMSMSGASLGPMLAGYRIDYRNMARRVLTFAIGASASLPAKDVSPLVAADDPAFRRDDASAAAGIAVYGRRCITCHGVDVVAAGAAPDLRTSSIPVDEAAFDEVVRKGVLVPQGMPRFEELSADEFANLRQYIRTESAKLRARE